MRFDAKKAEAIGMDLKNFQDFSDCFGFFFKSANSRISGFTVEVYSSY